MEYNRLPAQERIDATMAALATRGITAIVVQSKEEALQKVNSLIPDGVSVMTGASVTLEQIGFVDHLKSGNHPWKNLKAEITAEKDPAVQKTLRKQGTLADVFLGSVHAVTEQGELLIASNTGSQLPAYAFSSDHIIWVVGAQKIVATMDEAMHRLEDYVVPLEDEHMKSLYGMGTALNKLLVIRGESPHLGRTLHMILINDVVGF